MTESLKAITCFILSSKVCALLMFMGCCYAVEGNTGKAYKADTEKTLGASELWLRLLKTLLLDPPFDKWLFRRPYFITC